MMQARCLKTVDRYTPFYVFLSFVGVRGYRLGLDDLASWWWKERARALRDDTVLLPEVILKDTTTDPQHLLIPVFNRVANAFGLPRSPNYVGDGEQGGGGLR